MAPNVRRSWAPRGQTPILRQRTRHHQKVSMISVLCVSPERDKVQLFFRLHPDANIDTSRVIEFLRYLSRELENPIVLIWDRLLTHRSRKMLDFLAEATDIHTELLPPYAPELNPVENVWGYLKNNPLANFAAYDVVDDLPPILVPPGVWVFPLDRYYRSLRAQPEGNCNTEPRILSAFYNRAMSAA